MPFNKKYKVEPGFESLFTFKTKEEEREHKAKMMMFRFLSEFEKLNVEKPVKKKDLAKRIGTSPSFISQLFQGDKLTNLLTLAKMQEAYDFTYEIKAVPNSLNYSEEVENSYNKNCFNNNWIDENGYWLYISKNPDYNVNNITQAEEEHSMKVA